MTAVSENSLFDRDLQQVALRLRGSVTHILEAVGGHTTHVKEICDKLGVHRKLGWQITKIASEVDPYLVARHIPSTAGMKTFLEAAAKRNAPKSLLASANEAMLAFDEFVERHADTREMLDTMLGTAADMHDEGTVIAGRRAMFNGASSVFGIQAKTILISGFLNVPSGGAEFGDAAILRNIVGIRRLRSNASWILGRSRIIDGADQVQSDAPILLGDPPAKNPDGSLAYSLPLISQFCSKPLPAINRRRQPDGHHVDELMPGAVGKTEDMNLVWSEVFKGVVPPYRLEGESESEHLTIIQIPSENLVFDVFVHKDLYVNVNWEAKAYVALGNPLIAPREGVEWPLIERLESPGRGLNVVSTPEVPQYADMVRFVCSKLGWNPEHFQLHRLKVKFPPVASTIVLRHQMPERPVEI